MHGEYRIIAANASALHGVQHDRAYNSLYFYFV